MAPTCFCAMPSNWVASRSVVSFTPLPSNWRTAPSQPWRLNTKQMAGSRLARCSWVVITARLGTSERDLSSRPLSSRPMSSRPLLSRPLSLPALAAAPPNCPEP